MFAFYCLNKLARNLVWIKNGIKTTHLSTIQCWEHRWSWWYVFCCCTLYTLFTITPRPPNTVQMYSHVINNTNMWSSTLQLLVIDYFCLSLSTILTQQLLYFAAIPRCARFDHCEKSTDHYCSSWSEVIASERELSQLHNNGCGIGHSIETLNV